MNSTRAWSRPRNRGLDGVEFEWMADLSIGLDHNLPAPTNRKGTIMKSNHTLNRAAAPAVRPESSKLRRWTLAVPVLAVGACLATLPGHAGTIAYESPAPLAGNQSFDGTLGLDFDVACGSIVVTKLGAFDANQDGMQRTIRVYIYDRDTQTAVVGPIEFSPGDPGTLVGGSRFKTLTTPVVLPGGFHGSVAAENYGAEEQLRGFAEPPLSTLNSGGGLIEFVGSSRYGLTQGAFPDTVDEGPVNRYHAGTFEFEPGPGPAIEVPPYSFTAHDGDLTGFSVTATGVETLSYQWQFNGVNIDFETNPDLALFVTAASAGQYRVRVTDGNGDVRCAEANLIVAPAEPVLAYDPATIMSGTASSYGPGVANYFDVAEGTSIQVTDLGTVLFESALTNTVTVQLFSVATTSVLATVTFDGSDVPTPVASTPELNLFLKPLSTPLVLGPGSYAVAIFGSSPGAQFIRDAATPTINGNGAIIHRGSRFASLPGGVGSLPGNTDGTGFTYLAGTFRMIVSGAPAITGQPRGGIFAPGSDITLSVQAGGSLPLTYQWRKGGTDITGANDATLPLTAVNTGDGGDYDVVITNTLGSVTSLVASIIVAEPPTVAIHLHAGIAIDGIVGLHYRVEYREFVDPPDAWQLLVDIPSLPSTPYTVFDPAPAEQPKRFYQVLLVP